MNRLLPSELNKLAVSLVEGARLELRLTPKPGLVDLADCGAHPDLSVALMEQSIDYVADYLDEIAASLIRGEGFEAQNRIGIKAEQRQSEALGTNTHKGYIFLSGMLLIAAWHAGSTDEAAIRANLSERARSFFATHEEPATHGGKVRRKFHAGGIVSETAQGFPSVFDAALPAYRAAKSRRADFAAASFAMLARLMQTVEDTTTLHRGGAEGLELMREHGRQLEQRLAEGPNVLSFLEDSNRLFVRHNLTMGGVADMLGLSYGWLIHHGEAPLPT